MNEDTTGPTQDGTTTARRWTMADRAAALVAGTVATSMVLGLAYPRHGNSDDAGFSPTGIALACISYGLAYLALGKLTSLGSFARTCISSAIAASVIAMAYLG